MGSQKPFKILPQEELKANRTGTQGASISVGEKIQRCKGGQKLSSLRIVEGQYRETKSIVQEQEKKIKKNVICKQVEIKETRWEANM